jgi:hypothetical protein
MMVAPSGMFGHSAALTIRPLQKNSAGFSPQSTLANSAKRSNRIEVLS